jgi:hypothetical protein
MKLEQVRKYEVRSFYEPEEKDVIVDEKGNILYSSCIGEDEFYTPSKEDYYFDTKEDADKFYSQLISKFDIEAIKEYINFLCDNDRLNEILPESLFNIFTKRNNSFYLSYGEERQIRSALNGILNIDAVSFRVSDVYKIKYGDTWLSIELKDGSEVVPTNETEVFIIQSIFGDNNSERYNRLIKKP